MQSLLDFKSRGTLIERFDPRALVIFYLCFAIVAMFVQDVRLMAMLAVMAGIVAVLSKLSWAQTRRSWISLAILIAFFTAINLVIGRGVIFAITQALRLLTLFLITLAITSSLNPADYGIAFRKLGAPDKLAFAISLMLRFVPTLTRDFQITIDAQRARGFELDAGKGKLWERAKRYGPMLVPVIVPIRQRGGIGGLKPGSARLPLEIGPRSAAPQERREMRTLRPQPLGDGENPSIRPRRERLQAAVVRRLLKEGRGREFAGWT